MARFGGPILSALQHSRRASGIPPNCPWMEAIVERRYFLVDSAEKLDELRAQLAQVSRVAIDTETTGLDIYSPDFQLVGVCLATSPWEGAYIPVNHENFAGIQYQPDNIDNVVVADFLREVFATKDVVMHNAAYDRPVLAKTLSLDFDVTQCDDTKVGMHLVDENQRKGLKYLSAKWLGATEMDVKFIDVKTDVSDWLRKTLVQTDKEDAISVKTGRKYKKNVYSLPSDWQEQLKTKFFEVAKDSTATPLKFLFDFFSNFFSVLKLRNMAEYEGSVPNNFKYLPVSIAQYYAIDDAMNTYGVWLETATRLELDGTFSLYKDIDLAVDDIMMRASYRGIRVDKDMLRGYGEMLNERIQQAESEAFALLSEFVPSSVLIDNAWPDGTPFNANTVLSSTQQLQHLLFDYLGFPKMETTNSGNPSTNKNSLEKLLHEKARLTQHEDTAKKFIRLKLQIADIKKILTTYTYSLADKGDEASRIHPNFNITGTVSGRMSSSEPNFQNMPRLLPEELLERPWLQGVDIRRSMHAEKDHIFVDFDYSAMEMVVCAALSGDDNMRTLLNDKRDLHAHTARYAFDVGHDLNDKEFKNQFKVERQAAKIVNFAIIYGGTEWTLQRNFGFSPMQAVQLIEGYFKAYPGVKKWMGDVYAVLRTDGRITYPEYGFIKRLDMPNVPRGSREYDRQYSAALRSSQNALIQGTSAYIVKDAIRQMHAEFLRRGMAARVSFQVHDEIGCITPLSEAREVFDIMHSVMHRELNGVKLRADGGYKFSMSKSEEYATLEEALEHIPW